MLEAGPGLIDNVSSGSAMRACCVDVDATQDTGNTCVDGDMEAPPTLGTSLGAHGLNGTRIDSKRTSTSTCSFLWRSLGGAPLGHVPAGLGRNCHSWTKKTQ